MNAPERTDPPARRRPRMTNLLVTAAVPATAVLVTAMGVKLPTYTGD
jgi:hypothetical protein